MHTMHACDVHCMPVTASLPDFPLLTRHGIISTCYSCPLLSIAPLEEGALKHRQGLSPDG